MGIEVVIGLPELLPPDSHSMSICESNEKLSFAYGKYIHKYGYIIHVALILISRVSFFPSGTVIEYTSLDGSVTPNPSIGKSYVGVIFPLKSVCLLIQSCPYAVYAKLLAPSSCCLLGVDILICTFDKFFTILSMSTFLSVIFNTFPTQYPQLEISIQSFL